MYPAQGDEIILVLYEKEFFLIFGVTIIGPTALLRYDDVRHCKRVSGLQQKQVIPFDFLKTTIRGDVGLGVSQRRHFSDSHRREKGVSYNVIGAAIQI